MGTIIEATAVTSAGRGPFARGPLTAADSAARFVLGRASRTAADLDRLMGMVVEEASAESARRGPFARGPLKLVDKAARPVLRRAGRTAGGLDPVVGTFFEIAGAERARRGPFTGGALKLADDAARACLHRAGKAASDLDLLVNAGIYREGNLGEPALAALIQEDIGANPGHPPGTGHGTFSFDLYNGACGLLTGVQLLDGFLSSGTVRLGMVVASDADPGTSRGFAFPHVGAAILLGWDESHPGFTAFGSATFPEFADLFRSYVVWEKGSRIRWPGAPGGRNVLNVEIAETYQARALDCAESATKEFAAREGFDLADVDLLVATASVPAFARALAERLGIASERVASAREPLARAHTAGPAVALDSAMQDGRFAAAGTVLFVSAGAGITVANALYRQR